MRSTNDNTHSVCLSIGSNLGDRKRALDAAVRMIGEQVGRVEICSRYIETSPWGFLSENAFLNAALRVKTTLAPHELLNVTQRIERVLGRTEKSTNGHYHDRIIDIDILTYDDLNISDERLTIPHPRMYERDFVMEPLREIQ